jgi:hypothetical protein
MRMSLNAHVNEDTSIGGSIINVDYGSRKGTVAILKIDTITVFLEELKDIDRLIGELNEARENFVRETGS